MVSDPLLDRNCKYLDGACLCKSIKECKYASLYDKGCTYPECQCKVPYWAMSQDIRKQFCGVVNDF